MKNTYTTNVMRTLATFWLATALISPGYAQKKSKAVAGSP